MDETIWQEELVSYGVSETMGSAAKAGAGCCIKHHLRSYRRNRKLESASDEWAVDNPPVEEGSGSYSNLLRLHKHWAWHWSKSRQRKHHLQLLRTQNKCLNKDADHPYDKLTNYIDRHNNGSRRRISISSKTEIELAYSSSLFSSRCLKPDHNSTTTADSVDAEAVLHPDLNYYHHQTTTQTPNLTTNQNLNQCLSTHRISSNTSSSIRLKNTTTKDDTLLYRKPNSCLPKFTTFKTMKTKVLQTTLYNKKKANSTSSDKMSKSYYSSNWAVLAEIILFLILLFNFVNVTDAGNKNGFRCSEKNELSACLPKSYSKFELPIKGGVNKMKIHIDIIEVLRINDKDYSITFACYFNVAWLDKRIYLGPDFGIEQVGPGVNTTGRDDVAESMNLEFVKSLWLPNIFIYNLKTYKVIDVLSKLAGLWLYANGQVLYSQATHITFICPMRFDKFPLDTQVCKFQVGSYSYEDRIMTFETTNAGYSASKGGNSIALDYAITINGLSDADKVFIGGDLGNFSLAGFEMVLQRYVSTYIITYYLPSGLFVIVSWISFLIPMDVIPGRMALLVTLFLVLVNIFNTVTTNTPKAEGLTAIEAWMLACILFVFGALIE